MTSFSNRSLDEFVDIVTITLTDNEEWCQGIVTALQTNFAKSWNHVVQMVKDALFPDLSGELRGRGREEGLRSDHEQLRRYSKMLYQRVLDVRVHQSKKGWEFRCKLSGRTKLESDELLALSDKQLMQELIRAQRAVLLPADWWENLEPPTVWGWWVLPIEIVPGGMLVRSMERLALSDPPILLPLHGATLIMQAMRITSTEGPQRRWISLKDMGFTFEISSYVDPRSLKPRRGEVDQQIPSQVQEFLRRKGPLDAN
eukprot:3938692-Rhodomonas_salina.1